MSKNQPIIIKKVYKHEEGHHGGAWKVAYADFVTAMMAFFLLMWLLSTVADDKLRGLAQYFAPIDGGFTKTGEVEDSGLISSDKDPQPFMPAGRKGVQFFDTVNSNLLSSEDRKNFISTMNNIKQNQILQEYAENIVWDITSEGLRIQVMDSDNRPMFRPNTTELAPYMKDILNALAGMILKHPNYIAITGHTASIPENVNNNKFDYWEISTLRANEVRKFFGQTIPDSQVVRITGKADREPADINDPYGSKNVRITITLLGNGAVSKFQQAMPEKMMQKK